MLQMASQTSTIHYTNTWFFRSQNWLFTYTVPLVSSVVQDMHSDMIHPICQKFPHYCLWNSPSVGLIDDGPFPSSQGRLLTAAHPPGNSWYGVPGQMPTSHVSSSSSLYILPKRLHVAPLPPPPTHSPCLPKQCNLYKGIWLFQSLNIHS